MDSQKTHTQDFSILCSPEKLVYSIVSQRVGDESKKIQYKKYGILFFVSSKLLMQSVCFFGCRCHEDVCTEMVQVFCRCGSSLDCGLGLLSPASQLCYPKDYYNSCSHAKGKRTYKFFFYTIMPSFFLARWTHSLATNLHHKATQLSRFLKKTWSAISFSIMN